MKIRFSEKARREVKALDLRIQKRIRLKLEWYLSQENPLIFDDKLTDSELGTYRYRIGAYRVIFDVADDVIHVHRIGHLQEIYR